MSNPSNLPQWLAWLEELHPEEIDLGLERVSQVAERAALDKPDFAVITVAGTNGKGSVVEMLQQAYLSAGYKTGAYTSPHLQRFNERIRLDGVEASDDMICGSLAAVELHRHGTSLTYFEFTTLAAMHCFIEQGVDVALLEVGLGGRLDAVNLWDTDCAVVTSIGIDHESWLGSDRAVIASEKAAVARSGKPLIVGEADPPDTIAETANRIGAELYQIGRDFSAARVKSIEPSNDFTDDSIAPENEFSLRYESFGRNKDYPLPKLSGDHQVSNSACVLRVLDVMQERLPVSYKDADFALASATLPGRLQTLSVRETTWVLDVAHNPAAAKALSSSLASLWPDCQVHAVIAMMADKDIESVLDVLGGQVSSWHCAGLSVERALPAAQLADKISTHLPGASVALYDTVEQACWQASDSVAYGSREIVLVFGSFFTVSDALQVVREESNGNNPP